MSNTATFNTSPNLKLSKKLSFGEEVANSVTHAVGAVAMLVLQRLRHDCCGRDVCFRYQPFPHVFELSHLPCYGLQLTPQDGSKNY